MQATIKYAFSGICYIFHIEVDAIAAELLVVGSLYIRVG